MGIFLSSYIEKINTLLRVNGANGPLVVDLFAGCGGLALGFEAAGFQTVGFEMNQDACATYEANLKGACHRMFLTPTTPLPNAPVIIGGPPCQPFSVGGFQRGLHDSRDGFPSFISAVARGRPEIWLFENVRGLMYQNKWYLKEIISALRGFGYIVEVRLLNVVNFGVPQNRERVVVVGHRGRFSFPEPLDYEVAVGEAIGETAHLAPDGSRFLTSSMDRYVANYEKASKCIVPRDLHLDRPSRTLTCRNLAGATGDMMRVRLLDGRRRRLLYREAARIQSFPDWFEFIGGETSQFNQIGNAVAPLFAFCLANSVKEYLASDYRMSDAEIQEYNRRFEQETVEVRMTQGSLFGESEDRKPSLDRETGLVISNEFLSGQVRTDKKAGRKPTTKEFLVKPPEVQNLINEMLYILSNIGIPVHRLTPRKMEKMAMVLLALADVSSSEGWPGAKDIKNGYSLTTRKCIAYINSHFGEKISSGSYDDIRRESLVWPIIRGMVVPSKSEADDNDGTRGYAISPEYSLILRQFRQDGWEEHVRMFVKGRETLDETLKIARDTPRMPVILPGGDGIAFGKSQHNRLQKAIIEEFLPIWGQGARVLYVGDTSDKDLYVKEDELTELNIPIPDRSKLPDIIAYSQKANRLYLIEAVHTSGTVSNERRHMLEELTKDCPAYIVYVTAFQTWERFKKHTPEIGWETEVWVAEAPEHLIHFNGEKFLPNPQAD